MHLHLDCFVGISGDMTLAALIDLGVDPRAIEEGLAGMGRPFRLETRRVTKQGISSTALTVVVEEAVHVHEHDPAEEHHHHHHHHGLSYSECRHLLHHAELPPRAEARALAVLEAVGRAEAAVHGVEVEKIHFHELGGVDTLVDIGGACLALELLGVDSVSASPIPLSHGFVRCEHGLMPVPPPATAKLTEGLPVRPVDIEGETVTPTGAALIRGLASEVGPIPPMRVTRVAHGAGQKDFAPYPNVLRVLLGERDDDASRALVAELRTQIDDASGETLAYACERLLAEGALDVFTAPITMKKGRPAIALTVLAKPEDADRLAAVVLTETTAIGLRLTECRRMCLEREMRTVATPWGEVRVKFVRLPDGGERGAPEYEDCARLARQSGVPLLGVWRAALTG